MRRVLFLMAVAGLSGCSGFRDLLSAHADVAARAAGQEFTVQQLAGLMARGKGMKPTHEVAERLSDLWVDFTLFSQAAAEGRLPLDSAAVAEAMWPQLTEIRATHWHDTLLAHRTAITPAMADSVYQADSLRILQHILFTVRPQTPPAQRALARKKAEGTLARIRQGADFGVLAAQLSEDPGSKEDEGYLPPSPRGAFVTAFDSAGWSLSPGATSGIVETPFGYHIIRRPALTVARERLVDYLTQQAGVRLDSLYMDSLATALGLEVSKSAPAAIRGALGDRESARRSGKSLASFHGGKLTMRELMRWLDALPPPYAAQLQGAPDSVLAGFTRVVGQNILLVAQADSAGIRVTPEEWAEVAGKYRAGVDSLRVALALDPEATDSSIPLAERRKVAVAKVDGYFDRLVTGQARLHGLPATLGNVLRARAEYRVIQSGVEGAVALASVGKAAADSARDAPRMRPAPGPAPLPGGMPPAPQGGAPPRQ